MHMKFFGVKVGSYALGQDTLVNDDNSLLRYSLLYTFALGLCAHAFAFLNLSPSQDALVELFYTKQSGDWQISLGRVLEPLYHSVTGSSATFPWTTGLISLLWIGITVFLTAKLFNIRHKVYLLLMAGFFATNETVTATVATYAPWLGSDMLALLLATSAASCWQTMTERRDWRFFLLGVVLITVSLGLYQAYLAVAIVLIILASMISLLTGEKGKVVFRNGLLGIGMILLGCLLYYPLTKIICAIANVSLVEGENNSLTRLWSNSESFFTRLVETITDVGIKVTVYRNSTVYPKNLIRCIYLVLAGISFVKAALIIRQQKIKGVPLLLFLALFAILPIGANAIRMLTPRVYDLMFFGIWILLITPLLLYAAFPSQGSGRFSKYANRLVCLCLGILLFGNIQTANMIYVEKELRYDATLSIMTHVMQDIEKQADYAPGATQVVIVGNLSKTLLPLPGDKDIGGISGAIDPPISYDYTYQNFFSYVLQKEVNVINHKDLAASEEMANNAYVKQMPCYPVAGYVAEVQGVLVVKLSEP